MGISHPLSDEYDALRGAVFSPERTPPSSPLGHHFLEHEVTRMDTLAGIAIKYGVEISDIKRANSLVTDSQMFAHKTLLIPLPGMPMPSSVKLNGSGQRMERARAPNHQQNRDTVDSLESSKSGHLQGASPAMNTLQRYYGLTSQEGDCSTEMSVYHKGGFQSSLSETLLISPAAPGTNGGTDRSWNSEGPAANGFSAANVGNVTKGNGAPKGKQDGWIRRRQKVEAECNTADGHQDDFLAADPIKLIKNLLLPRPISSVRLNMDTGIPDSSQKSSISFLNNGLKSVRKSPSTPRFADAENGGVSMWSSSKWTFNHDSFTRPLLDAGLPKPVSARRTKTA